jgi:hypothetical protein
LRTALDWVRPSARAALCSADMLPLVSGVIA